MVSKNLLKQAERLNRDPDSDEFIMYESKEKTNPRLIAQAARHSNPALRLKTTFEPLTPENSRYIPILHLIVADYPTMFNVSWYQTKQILDKKDYDILNPSQFWMYHDYCKHNEEKIFEDSIMNEDTGEWLNALVRNDEELIVNVNLEDTINFGNHIYRNLPRESGTFASRSLDFNSGFPQSLNGKVDFSYLRQETGRGFTAVGIRWSRAKQTLCIDTNLAPQQNFPQIGVRQCRDLHLGWEGEG